MPPYDPMPPAPWRTPPQREPNHRSAWTTVGIVLGIITLLAGLMFLAFMIWAYLAVSQWGSNK